MKHRLVLTDEELDSIRASLGQVMAKGTVIPDLVRFDYKLERLRQAKSRIKKAEKSSPKIIIKQYRNVEEAAAKPDEATIEIVR